MTESSGVVASRQHADVYWTHNDSGSRKPLLYAFRLNAQDRKREVATHLGTVELEGASNRDWEDIAYGPVGRLYVFDGGDNPPCTRDDKRIHRLLEPDLNNEGRIETIKRRADSIRFEYPAAGNSTSPTHDDDDRYDAEALFVHPKASDLYIVTKRDNKGAGATRVYKLTASELQWNSDKVHVLTLVADLTDIVEPLATAADIDHAGNRVIIRNYVAAYEFTLPPSGPFDKIFDTAPTIISFLGETQGEGVPYTHSGDDLIPTAELIRARGVILGPQRFPVYRTPWQLANLHVDVVAEGYVVVRWETAQPGPSRVSFGPTTDYGQTVEEPTPKRRHALRIKPPTPGTKYYYQVASGSHVFPPAPRSKHYYFSIGDESR